ncbi:MAG: mechanosensitive ion channel family protein [Cyclobacteriaceae bacterium]|jgi:small-conductance mechanosensitive channel|nr:mechanosensitive ion channel family protein [Cyclobacteriaceae bacterium]MDH4296039.1 mechanosensitive ion channel family protein [Cyclobacteriaceae bacterium]MDH5249807.1 mechanosensitive ion channel family protein [Cyclobacteriaceae bacterium]
MRLFAVLLIGLIPLCAYAQEQDSAALAKTARLVKQMDSIQREDSLKRMALMQEIERLQGSTDYKAREALAQRLKTFQQEDSIKKIKKLQQLEALRAKSLGYPVAPFGDTLFMIRTSIASFSAKDRAYAISDKIQRLYDDNRFNPDSLLLQQSETSTEIFYGEMMVISVNELEAMWFGKKTEELALEYRDVMKQAILAERKEHSIINIVLRIAAIVLIIVGIYLLILLINRLFRKLNAKVSSIKDQILNGIRFRGYQFLDSDRELQVVLFIINMLRLLIIGIALYITLPLLFSVFPWTRGIAETLIGWVMTPLRRVFGGLIAYLPNLFTILVIGAVTHYVVKFLTFIAGEIENGALSLPGFYPDWSKPTLNIVKFLLYAFSFIIIFPYLPGSDSPIFQGVSVFVGILFSLGSSSAISNAVAGLVITYMRPFKTGDRVKIGEITGDVVEKTLLVTRIRTVKNESITIPNAAILAGHTINYTISAKELGLILHTSVTIGYDVPWKQVHALLINAALQTEGILNEEERKPFVLQTSLDDFYVAYQINAYTRESHKLAGMYSELHQHIQDNFNEAGVEILSPHYRAARDGNMTTVPADYLPKDYKAPTFNISTQHSATKEKE